MIIGSNKPNENKFKNNNFLNNNSFDNKFKHYQENANSNYNRKNIFTEDISTMKYTNINNKNEMYTKSIALLHDRLSKGLITLDEFNKQINRLTKQTQK